MQTIRKVRLRRIQVSGVANIASGTSVVVAINWVTVESTAVIKPVGATAGTLSYVTTANTLTISSTATETALEIDYAVFK